MTSYELRVQNAVDRVMRLWSLIKMVPECGLSDVRSAVVTTLSKHGDRTENEMVLIGFKHLNRADGPKDCQKDRPDTPARTKSGARRRKAPKTTPQRAERPRSS